MPTAPASACSSSPIPVPSRQVPARRGSPIPLTIPTHARALAQAIRSIDHPRLLIIDTLPSILDPGTTSTTEVMRILHDLAQTYSLSILALTHLSKHRAHRPIYRVRGSLTYSAAARTILMLTADPDDPDRRILSTMKSVYTRAPSPLAFRILDREHTAEPQSFASLASLPSHTSHTSLASFSSLSSSPPPIPLASIQWEPLPLAPISPDLLDLSPDSQSALTDALRFLESELASGPRLIKELAPAAKANGFSFGTLRRAKRLLRVRSLRAQDIHAWQWSLPITDQIKTPAASRES